jgi:hypothetical protein
MDARTMCRLAFVAAVTCWLLALVFAAAGERPLEAGAYAVTAALGLEYLVSAWPSAGR